MLRVNQADEYNESTYWILAWKFRHTPGRISFIFRFSVFFFIIDGMKLEKKKRTNFIYYIASVYRSMAHFLWSTKHSHAYALPYSWRWSVCARAFTLPINNINFWSTFLLTSLARNTHWSAESNADARSISEFCIRNSVIGAALLECSSQNSKNASEIA